MLPTFVFDGRPLEPQPVPIVVADRMLLPIRPLAGALGATVAYDPKTRTVTVRSGARRAELRAGVATIVGGRAYAPPRELAAALDTDIVVDGTGRRIALGDAPDATPASGSNPVRAAYIARVPKPGERSFDVVVHGRPNGWGFVTTDASTLGAPLIFQGGDTFVAHVVVPSGIAAFNAHAFVCFATPDTRPVTVRVPTALDLDTRSRSGR